MKVWFVDDLEDNRRTWLASFPAAVRASSTFATFASVPELFAALDDGQRPDILFVDFFLDGHYGLEVVDRLLTDDLPPPVLIAHSSLAEANAGLLRSGAHLALSKVRGVARTRSIVEAIRSVDDLEQLVRTYGGQRRLAPPPAGT